MLMSQAMVLVNSLNLANFLDDVKNCVEARGGTMNVAPHRVMSMLI